MITWWPIVVMSRPCLYRLSGERGSCRSLWPTHERTYVGPKDYEDRLFMVYHGCSCCHFVQRCLQCQMHGDLIHMPPSELHALTSPWPWGIDIIGKILLKSSSGHEYILVAIEYFTKWVEVASYARLIAAKVATFIRSHIICRYGVPHELISNRGVNFRGEVDTLV